MPDDIVIRLRAILDAATPPPWNTGHTSITEYDENALLIVAAVNALPALLDVAEAAKEVVALLGEQKHLRGTGSGKAWDDMMDALERLDAEGEHD